jgi:hypothetical protein
LLERAWQQAMPGREAAAVNEVLRALQCFDLSAANKSPADVRFRSRF